MSVPSYGKDCVVGRSNKDLEAFLRYFLPRGKKLTPEAASATAHYLHLAFKGMEVEEIYNVLMEQFLATLAKYDPFYTEKVKLVVEVIDHELAERKQFSINDVNRYLDIDGSRYLRMLSRRV